MCFHGMLAPVPLLPLLYSISSLKVVDTMVSGLKYGVDTLITCVTITFKYFVLKLPMSDCKVLATYFLLCPHGV